MLKQGLIRIATALLFITGAQAHSEDITASEFKVRITEQGTCELAAENVACTAVSSKVLALCPSRKCKVLITSAFRGSSGLMVATFKSLVEEHFASVSYKEHRSR